MLDNNDNSTLRIALWSGPRNISTTLMYSFAQRPDTIVVDEPLFGHFLKVTGALRPSREEVMATMETDAKKIICQELLGSCDLPVFFMKHIANHLEGLELDFISNFQNIILTREPKEMLASYSQHIKNPTLQDTAYEYQTQLLDYLENPIVLDAKKVLQNPEGVLRKLCEHLDIPFYSDMLAWEPGPRKEDGVWAKYWYANLHKSDGFAPYKKKEVALPHHLTHLCTQCEEHYNKLLAYAIEANE